jgi:hypothetical protein
MNNIEFFRRILPDDGLYCCTIITKEGKTKNIFCRTLASLEKTAQDHNGRVHVYHACSTYKEAVSRKKSNIHSTKSFWMDVDIREDKGYRTLEEAIRATKKFVEEANLPFPLLVFSGGGLHLYWPLTQAVEQDEWNKYAEGIFKLAERLKFKADPGISKDGARILRTPGTQNIKEGNGKYAEVLNDVGPFELSQFSIFTFQNLKTPAEIKEATVYAKDADIYKIIGKCKQVQMFSVAEEQITGQHWIACGRVMAQCHNGTEELWHQWSALDDRYIEDEAQKKWQESVEFNNGITCAHFKSINPDGCKGCPHSVKSPVQLGRDDRISEELPEEIKEQLGTSVPYPYVITAKNQLVIRTKKSEEGELEDIEISKFPFVVADRTTSELDVGSHSIIIRHYTPMEKWIDIEISLSDWGSNPIAALTKVGIMVTNDKLARDYVRTSYNELAANKNMTKVHETYGWKEGNKFLLGDRMYSYKDGKLAFETVHLGLEARNLAPALRPGGHAGRGSVSGWRSAAQGLFSKGHEWQAATLLCAAGAPLLALLDDVEGGTIWSLFDRIGGKGKSTATIAGATLWGSYEALSTQAADTINARMAKLGTLRHLPLAYDEMRRDNPGVAKQFVQSFTAGAERSRMSRSATVNRMPRGWRTVLLTSSNSELTGAIAADEGSEAMSDRVFEVHADSLPLRKGEINASLKAEFITNCGYAGPIIIGLILRDLDNIKTKLASKEKQYMAKFNDPKLRFRAQLVAVVDVIGELISKSELLTFDHQYYVDWMIKNMADYEERHSTSAPELLARYIRENQNSILYINSFKPGEPKKHVAETRSGKVNIRVEPDTHQIIIPRADLATWLQGKEQAIKSFLAEMIELGALEAKNIKRTLTAGTQLTSGLEYVLVFRGDHEALSGVEKVIPLPQAAPSKVASSLRLATLAK